MTEGQVFMKKPISLTLILLATFTLSACQKQGITEKISQSVSKTKKALPKKDTHPDWQILENKNHKFSFKYPQSWKLSVNADREDLYSFSLSKKDISQENIIVYEEEMVPSYSISIMVNKNSKNLSAREYYLNQFGVSSKESAEEKIEEITIAGVKAIKHPEGAAPASGPATGILLARNQKIYSFVYSALAYKETHEKFLQEFMEILETLEFSE